MIRRARVGVVLALGIAGALAPAHPASAHPFLQQAAPAAGRVAPSAPTSVSLAMSEPGVARGTRITVTGPRGVVVPTRPVRASRDGRVLTARFARPLRSAVYRVRWRVLGDDGHVVGGTFAFGAPGRDGTPPAGAQRLDGSGGRGGTADVDGAVSVLARWLGIAGASLLLGALALTAALRRRRVPVRDGLGPALTLAWILVVVASIEGLLVRASRSGGDGLDLGLLWASATGRAELSRAAVVVAGSLALLLWRDRRAVLLPVAGAAVLVTYAISGHVLADAGALAIAGQVAHVLSAGLWLGGVLALILLRARCGVSLRDGARAFAPLAAGALVVVAGTGVLSAIREVDDWYFLRWSGYGRVVIVKAALVALVAAAGAAAAWRGARTWQVRTEAVGLLVVIGLAATMSGLAQGRGQPLPAQRGTLFAGPAFATTIGGGHVTLAPARRGPNTLVVGFDPEARAPRRVAVRLSSGARSVRVALRRTAGAWSARVALPADGTWFGYVELDGRPADAPVALTVGVPRAPGSTPDDVLAVADLTGPDAARCRAHLVGLELAIARLNGEGGLDRSGRKLALRALDGGGRPGAVARAAIAARRPVAVVGACGSGSAAAVAAASRAGVPAISGDPTVGPVSSPGAVRLARDPYAEGLAFAQLIRERVLPTAPVGVRMVRVASAGDAYGAALRRGLRDGLADVPIASLRGSISRQLDRRRTLAVVVDGAGGGGAWARRLAAFGRTDPGLPPAVALLSGRALSEDLVRSAGSLGRLGVVQGVTEVAPTTRDGILYRRAVPLLFAGELPSLDGLRGYVTGLALDDATRDGTAASAIRAALRRPSVFTDALLAPWSLRRPGVGSPSVLPLQPQFLSPTLVPAFAGGERQTAGWFPDGTWTVTSTQPLGIRR